MFEFVSAMYYNLDTGVLIAKPNNTRISYTYVI